MTDALVVLEPPELEEDNKHLKHIVPGSLMPKVAITKEVGDV